MKKNIDKPVLSDEARKTLGTQIQSILMMARRHTKLSWRESRDLKKYEKKVMSVILFGDWEVALKSLYGTAPWFKEAFKKTIELLQDSRAELEGRLPEEDIEDIVLGARKLTEVYEYMTGRNFKTDKKIHEGALDA